MGDIPAKEIADIISAEFQEREAIRKGRVTAAIEAAAQKIHERIKTVYG